MMRITGAVVHIRRRRWRLPRVALTCTRITHTRYTVCAPHVMAKRRKKKQSGDWMCTIYNDDDDRFRLHLVCVSTGCVPGFNGGTFGNKPGIVDWNNWNPVLCFAEIGILWKLPVYIRLDFELILISISPRESYYNFFFDFRVSWYFAIKS